MKQPQPSTESSQDFFNARAANWADLWHKNPRARARNYNRHEFKRLLDLAPLRKNDVILDIGCGSGELVPHILQRLGPRGRLHEVDYAARMIAVNRQQHSDPRITFHVADVHCLPLARQSCDGIFCFSAFPHFRHKARALGELAAVLKPNGWLLLAHFDSPRTLDKHHAATASSLQNDRLPKPAALQALLTGAGLINTRHINEAKFYAFLAVRPR